MKEIETIEIDRGIMTISEKAMGLVIRCNADYVHAGEVLKLHKGMEKHIKEYFKPLKEAAHSSWKGICEKEAGELAKLMPIELHLKQEIGRYQAEQEIARKEAEDRLRLEAMRIAEDRRLLEAIQAEAEGDKDAAEEILNEEVFTHPPILSVSTPKIAGISTTSVWRWDLEDIKKVPLEYYILDESKIGAVVRALKAACRIPGIRIYEDKQIRARG